MAEVLLNTQNFYFWTENESEQLDLCLGSEADVDGLELNWPLAYFMTAAAEFEKLPQNKYTAHLFGGKESLPENGFALLQKHVDQVGVERIVLHPDDFRAPWYIENQVSSKICPVALENMDKPHRLGAKLEDLKRVYPEYGKGTEYVLDLCHCLQIGGVEYAELFINDQEFMSKVNQIHLSVPNVGLDLYSEFGNIPADHVLCVMNPSVLEPLLNEHKGKLLGKTIVLEGIIPPNRLDLLYDEIAWVRKMFQG
ncbi:MAG: hypothetical protein JKX97_04060 [Candidatus Lindowbacteria bacterium]|nr:hypothetical protein [Candidatus Lindowbacteria bacterium]